MQAPATRLSLRLAARGFLAAARAPLHVVKDRTSGSQLHAMATYTRVSSMARDDEAESQNNRHCVSDD